MLSSSSYGADLRPAAAPATAPAAAPASAPVSATTGAAGRGTEKAVKH